MDFRTMSSKLNQGTYRFMEEFAKDVELVFNNCWQFNPPATYPVICTDVIKKAFKKEWSKAMEKKLSWQEKCSLQGFMATLIKEDMFISLFYLLYFDVDHQIALGSSENLSTPYSWAYQPTLTSYPRRMPEI